MDIYLVNSGPSDFYAPKTPVRNALYRNNHDGTFTDVRRKPEWPAERWPFRDGAAAADFDGDGWQDLYVTNYGRNVLFHNNHDGTFTDVTDRAGVAAPNWSTCATWFDYDNDGRLDLFVSSFVHTAHRAVSFAVTIAWAADTTASRGFSSRVRVTSSTTRATGKFSDVSKASGIASSPGKSFGAIATDVNNDG